ncbi:Maltoporin [Vibrio tapetis subsp. tapetis]|uniref:Maltoporin n=2 Tax=Vibrio tapetis TaxID=52443 RepID=A0A2N8ZK26_9VIBR|nr:maltoporin [Vibrio tapetis]SON52261.1 Maltoporin [Vibrio tapetis subsp. tapetis]
MSLKKLSVIAAAVGVALTTGTAFAAGTDTVDDGWEVHGYMSSNVRQVDGTTTDNEFGKPNYASAGTSGKSTNQVEFTVKKHTEYESGVWADYVVRTEYGNGNSYAYSSSGSQKENSEAQFEVKEAYVELGGVLGEETSVWGGQRFLNRSAGILSGEFWKQSSGIGAGVQTKLAGHTAGVAYVMADPDAGKTTHANPRETLSSLDFYFYGVDVGFGKLDFDLKYMTQANQGDKKTSWGSDSAETGFGGSITLNTSYYGLDGWTQTGIGYGKGIASNRGSNFGGWSGDFGEDSTGIFATSYGVLNINDTVQLGTEVTYFNNDNFYGQDNVTRLMIAARPSVKINDNLRFEATGSIGIEDLTDGAAWGRKDKNTFKMVEVALPITANSDYFGRPQVKPYVAYYMTDEGSQGGLGMTDKTETVIGVHTEIWF